MFIEGKETNADKLFQMLIAFILNGKTFVREALRRRRRKKRKVKLDVKWREAYKSFDTAGRHKRLLFGVLK